MFKTPQTVASLVPAKSTYDVERGWHLLAESQGYRFYMGSWVSYSDAEEHAKWYKGYYRDHKVTFLITDKINLSINGDEVDLETMTFN